MELTVHLPQKLHRPIKIIAMVLALILTIYTGFSVLGAAASMQIPRLLVEGSPASTGLNYQDVSFISRIDRVTLKGWFIPGDGDSALIIVHGGFQPRVDPTIDTLSLTHDLVAKGYNILLFDLRGRGESAGKGLSLSNMDKDIGGAVDFLKNLGFPAHKIGILGYCSGAAGVCMFASQELVGAIVLDGCFTSVWDMVSNQASTRSIPHLAVDTFLPGVQLAAIVFYGYQPVNPIDVIDQVRCPILFIHEEDDDLVSTLDNLELENKSDHTASTLWQVENTAHSQAYQTHPVEYVNRLDSFFQSAFGTMGQTQSPR
jgi:pimeloyl-ACP methyl ester carboxylesterase